MILNAIKFKIIFFLAIIFFSTFFIINPGLGNTIKKIAVCPLEMNSTEDLSFLQKGLFSMLSSRLVDPGKVEIIERNIIDKALIQAQNSSLTKGTLNESKAKVIGKNIDVDYVLFGSLTIFGKSVSLDISMVDIKGKNPTLSFSRQAEKPGAAITELDKIANKINAEVFDRYPETITEPVIRQAYTPVRQKTGGFDQFQPIYSTSGVINGIRVNDFNLDKKNELVAVFDHEIHILEYANNSRLKLVKRIKDKYYMNIVSVDSADINKNGYPEIFVTRFHSNTGKIKSFVIEFDGKDYIKHKKILPWYLKIIKGANGRNILYGQENGIDGPYSAQNVFQIEFLNNSWVAGQKLHVPNGFNLLSMTRNFSSENNEQRTVFTKKGGRLAMFNNTGKIVWTSDYGFGGSRLYYKFSSSDMNLKNAVQDDTGETRVYFQPENLVFDFDSSDQSSLVVIKNKNSSGDTFQRIRNYKKGSIEILKLNNMGFLESKDRKFLPGQITCIDIADLNKNGQSEIIAAFVKKRSNYATSKSKTMIVKSKILNP